MQTQLYLGIKAPVRISGDIKGSAPCLIIGPKGVLNLKEGVIRAWRHVHMFPPHARKFGVRNGDLMALRVVSKTCSVMFEDVMVRIIDMPLDARRIVASKGNFLDRGTTMWYRTSLWNWSRVLFSLP